MVDGVTGVFTKPIDGAREEGVEGFFKGMGKGVVGLVTRPASGVIDFASGSFDAVMRQVIKVFSRVMINCNRIHFKIHDLSRIIVLQKNLNYHSHSEALGNNRYPICSNAV